MTTQASNDMLSDIERAHPEGMSVQQVVDGCAELGERLTEATFRKYVQLGLLPRSVRVGRKGHRRGSQGLYPASTVRQVVCIRRLMKQGFTIDEIQRRSLLLRGDIDAVDESLQRIFVHVSQAAGEAVERGGACVGDGDMERARTQAAQLIDTLRGIERRLSMHARMERAAV